MEQIPDNETFLDLPLKSRLVPLGFHLGESQVGHIEFKEVSIRISRFPTVINLKEQHYGKQAPDEHLRPVYDEYNIFQLTHHINIMDRNWVDQVLSFGFQVQYPKYVTIIDQFPKSSLQKRRAPELNPARLFGPDGRLADQDLTELSAPRSGQADVVAPEVICVGDGDYVAEWMFHRGNLALAGSHWVTHTLLIFNDKEQLEYNTQVYANFPVGSFLDRQKSGWQEQNCRLWV